MKPLELQRGSSVLELVPPLLCSHVIAFTQAIVVDGDGFQHVPTTMCILSTGSPWASSTARAVPARGAGVTSFLALVARILAV